MSSRARQLVPVLLFVAPILFFDRVCLAGESLYLRDLFNWFYPWRVFAADSLARLDFPLWNPYSYAGTPFLANMQSGLLYPLNIVFWLFDFPTAMRFFLVLQFGLAGLFMYLLLRVLSCRTASSITGALGFAYGGWMLSHIEFPNKLAAAAWLPLILMGVVLFGSRQRPITGLIIGSIGTACCVFAGYPQTTFTVLVGVGVVWCVDLIVRIARRTPPRQILLAAASLPAICLLGGLLSAVQIIPFLEAASFSAYREPLDRATIFALGMHPLHFLDLLMPHIFGAPGYNSYWGGSLIQFWLGHFYVGLAVVVLAAAAIWSAIRWQRSSILSAPSPRDTCLGPVILLILSALFCLGDRTPLATLCAEWVPGFAHFRWMSTTSLLVAFPLCWLAALGLDGILGRLESSDTRSRAAGPVLLGIVVLATIWGGLALSGSDQFGRTIHALVSPVLEPGQEPLIEQNLDLVRADAVRMALIAVVLAAGWFSAASGRLRPILFSALIPIVLFADLKLASQGINFSTTDDLYGETPSIVTDLRSRPDPHFRVYVPTDILSGDIHMYGSTRLEHFRWAKNLLLFNLNLPYRLFSASDGDPLRSDRSRRFHLLLESDDDDVRGRFLALDNIAVILEAGSEGSSVRTDVPAFLPRVIVSTGVRRVAPDSVLATMTTAEWNPYLETIVEDDFPGEPRQSPGVAVDYRVHDLTYTNNTVMIDVDSASDGYLVLADTHYPGWVATVDDRTTPIFTANYLFRGIDLPAGRHRVMFAYRPLSVAAGAVGSITGLLVLAAMVHVRRRKSAILDRSEVF